MQIAIKIFASLCLALTLFSIRPALAQSSGLWARQEGISTIGTRVFGTAEGADIRVIILSVIKIAISFVGLVFLALILVAGFKWMTAGGKEDQIKDATKHITNAVIGLIIVLAAWGITTFVLIRVKLIVQGNPSYNDPSYYEYNIGND